MDLRTLHAFIFDLDGCVYTGEALVPGVADVLAALRARKRRVLFLSNNSREDGRELQAKLDRLGIPARPEEVLSAAEFAGTFLQTRFGPSRVLAIGSPTLLRRVVQAGHRLIHAEEAGNAQVVLVGHDSGFTYETLAVLSRTVAAGAAFVAVNLDPRLPLEHGEFLPGCGALVEAVAAAAGTRPEIVGKPRPHFFQAALGRLQVRPGEAAMIGDSLVADVQGAQGAGLNTIWLAPPGAVPGLASPDITIHAFAELLAAL
ncbi:MAG TPA: HAD-IIA family hydrolase [Candidatus Sulfotelmatobacter sp.]|nr:HAD-IIA family hydrolase [Candidatus Sulfotelmatobacter sp.]